MFQEILRSYMNLITFSPFSPCNCDEGLDSQHGLPLPFCMKLYPATRTLFNRCSLNMSISLPSMVAQHQERR